MAKPVWPLVESYLCDCILFFFFCQTGHMLGVPGAASASGGPAVSLPPRNVDFLEFVN